MAEEGEEIRVFKYTGTTSRSLYQRGKEHWREISKGKKTHPLVIHFLEEHNGATQEVLFRVVGHVWNSKSGSQ